MGTAFKLVPVKRRCATDKNNLCHRSKCANISPQSMIVSNTMAHRPRGNSFKVAIDAAIEAYFRREIAAYPPSQMGRLIEQLKSGTVGTSGSYRVSEPSVSSSPSSGCFRGATSRQVHAARLRYTWRATPVERPSPDGRNARVVYHERNYPSHAECAAQGGWRSVRAYRDDLTAARAVVALNLGYE